MPAVGGQRSHVPQRFPVSHANDALRCAGIEQKRSHSVRRAISGFTHDTRARSMTGDLPRLEPNMMKSARIGETVQVTLPVMPILRRGMKSHAACMQACAITLGETVMDGRNQACRWRRGAAWAASLALWGGVASAQEGADSKRPSKEVYINKRDFEIPVVLNKSPDQIKELHLWFSADQGKTWEIKRTVPPTRKSFVFSAPSDGEYQFTLAHVKLDGTNVPADVKSKPAGMRVIVDTTAPDIRLKPMRLEANQHVGVSWTIDEPNPDLKTLQVKLKTKQERGWHELNVRQAIEGKIDWPTDPGDDYVVEVSLMDRAGNQGSKTLDISGYGGEPTSRNLPPIAKADLPKNDLLDAPPAPSKGATPLTGFEDLLEPAPPKVARKSEPTIMPEVASTKPRTMEPTYREPVGAERPTSVPQSSTAMTDALKAAAANIFNPSAIDMPPQKPAGEEEVVATRMPKKAAEETSLKQVTHTEALKPVEPKIKLVNSPRFRMRYSVAGVGPSGVGAVELWMTKDNGATWALAGTDPDLESPIDVNLPGDGHYGLTVVVKNKAGGGQRKPVAGEQPQLRVDVDTDAPFAKLTKVDADPASPRDSMMMAWETEDEHPAERAVDLYFTHDPERGWYKIAGGLPPKGTHSWKVPQGVPYQVYFMLMARDQAGNVEKIYSPKPISIDLSNPQGKIDSIIDVLPTKKGDDAQN